MEAQLSSFANRSLPTTFCEGAPIQAETYDAKPGYAIFFYYSNYIILYIYIYIYIIYIYIYTHTKRERERERERESEREREREIVEWGLEPSVQEQEGLSTQTKPRNTGPCDLLSKPSTAKP